MLYVVLFFLLFSLLLYVMLGGADFGAGIVELFASKNNRANTRDIIYKVIGPVWEANHIWLIILLVILWVAFPVYFNIIVIYLHIPLTLVLLGITIRGVAFVFRHYDAVVDKSQFWYNWLFRIGSFMTPIFLGLSFSALINGKIILIEDHPSASFYDIFIQPWFNVFGLLTGLFYASLCAFLAATLLIGESEGKSKQHFSKSSATFTVVLVVVGFILLTYGYSFEIKFIQDFIVNPLALASVALSGILLIPLWKFIKQQRKIASRYLAGIQVILILFAAIVTHFPYFIITSNEEISILENIAPESTINNLGWMLIIGGSIILPGLFHLMKSFKMIKILEKS
ncbi:cytochrome d ubiquinol oxidase subunit II [Belliella kenyensis]|uniref:Cytochrome d ubiquinol oxidase subunit II n=1 Tax=Belliella kenyensis TaxID=1472724 RepID=A0ABV8EM08_9BACT|nr:cytochrome d ubiquinol oxidase subunit II [Belliella kenyensis]MCH7403026.1 cytochrome d ubiquinol oxidase subunit II [Belliella kenyensis]MDN3605062.1 cytochrome d ubiquinol oxidase subunit II [Belliella kenyensis]